MFNKTSSTTIAAPNRAGNLTRAWMASVDDSKSADKLDKFATELDAVLRQRMPSATEGSCGPPAQAMCPKSQTSSRARFPAQSLSQYAACGGKLPGMSRDSNLSRSTTEAPVVIPRHLGIGASRSLSRGRLRSKLYTSPSPGA